jgi:hypothetical protein
VLLAQVVREPLASVEKEVITFLEDEDKKVQVLVNHIPL